MNDKKLLELAAKACGYKIVGHANGRGLWLSGFSDEWDPLSDDAEAFQLASKFMLTVDFSSNTVTYPEAFIGRGDCARMATRRAIVLAAASLAE